MFINVVLISNSMQINIKVEPRAGRNLAGGLVGVAAIGGLAWVAVTGLETTAARTEAQTKYITAQSECINQVQKALGSQGVKDYLGRREQLSFKLTTDFPNYYRFSNWTGDVSAILGKFEDFIPGCKYNK